MTEPAKPAADTSRPAVYHVDADGKLRRELTVSEIADVVRGGKGELWVDMRVGSRQCIAMLDNVFTFHPLAVEDALNPVSRVKVDEYPGFLFAIVRGVRFAAETNDPYDLETFNISFFLGPNYLVTVHGGESPAFEAVAERVVRHPEVLQRGAERVMHAIMDSAIDAYFPLLDQIDEFIDGVESRVFQQFDQSALQDIFQVKRLVLSLRRHLSPQREVFNVLSNRPTALLAPDMQVYFRDIYDHNLRINESLETYRDLLGSTLDSYLTQVSNRLGMITKGLSVVATISIPFVVVSGMWGMNFAHIPLAQEPHAFWYMLALQLALSAGLLIILRMRKLI
ncbi:MAG: magnesium transporter CorA family protein [Gemmatimonadaceae bacterium]